MKHLKQNIFIIILLASLSFQSCSDSATGPQNEIPETEFRDALNNYISENSSILGMIALIEKPGKVSIGGTAGRFDINNSKSLEITDKFHIGSTSKTFVAAIVLQLMEERLLELDSAIIKYLPSHIAEILIEIPFGKEISVYHALSHRSGLYNFTDDPNCIQMIFEDSDYQCDPEYILRVVKDYATPIFKPGEDYSYSNTNYILLGKVIENITNKKLHIVLKERIYDIVGMTDTYLSGYETRIGETARAYVNNIDCLTLNTGFTWSAGGMVSSVSDMLKFFKALNLGLLFQNPATLDLMKTDSENDNYTVGFELYDSPQYGTMYGHSGGILGYISFMFYSTEANTYLCVGITLEESEIPDESLIDSLIDSIQ
ncbi:serine hydrolase domain-containing protein [Bacteroidota bacterium]